MFERVFDARVVFQLVREKGGRPSSTTSTVGSDTSMPYYPFSIEPALGKILPGRKAEFTVKFSPLDVSEYEARLVCT